MSMDLNYSYLNLNNIISYGIFQIAWENIHILYLNLHKYNESNIQLKLGNTVFCPM